MKLLQQFVTLRNRRTIPTGFHTDRTFFGESAKRRAWAHGFVRKLVLRLVCVGGLRATAGIGTSTNRTEAARWFRIAWDAGNARAQNYLGWAYVQGWGVERDYSAARFWLEKSAAANDRIGLYNYAFVHERGLGGQKDLVTATELYRRAAAAGYADAHDALRRLRAE